MTDWIFFGPAALIAQWPYAGLALAGGLIALSLLRDPPAAWDAALFRRAPVLAGLLWVLFSLYEWQVAAVWPIGGGAPFVRYDLIVLVPVLYVLTAVGLRELWKGRASPGESPLR